MKKFKRFSNYKFYHLPPQKNNLLLLILFFLIFIGIRCNDQNDDSPKPDKLAANLNVASGTGADSKSISSILGIMYLENFHDPSANQLAKLLCDESYKKLIFQFYKLKNGKLTLAAFAVKQNNKDFNPNFQILGLVDNTVVEDIQDKEVFMGDQKLEYSTGLQTLKDAMNKGAKNDSTKNYIVFTPVLKKFSSPNLITTTYVIEIVVSFSDTLKGLDPHVSGKSPIKLNPSPPYN